MKRIAIYPGSFDPVTNGHLDIVERGLKLFDKIIVAVMHNPGKASLFTVEERIEKQPEKISQRGIRHLQRPHGGICETQKSAGHPARPACPV